MRRWPRQRLELFVGFFGFGALAAEGFEPPRRAEFRASSRFTFASVAFETVAAQEVGARMRQELSRASSKRGPAS